MARQRATGMGKVLTLYAPKAGVGTTVIACNLAVAIQQVTAAPVVLIDADLGFGSVGTLLGLEGPTSGAGHGGSSPEPLIPYSDGLSVWLAEPAEPGTEPSVPLDRFAALLDEACRRASFVIVDAPSAINPLTDLVLRRADRVLMVLTPEAPSVQHCQSFLHWCQSQGLAEKVSIVVNRHASESSLPPEMLEELFGERLVARLPSEGVLVVKGVNSGRPFVETDPDDRLSVEVRRLARLLASD